MIRREIKPRQIMMRGQKTWIVRVPVDLRGNGKERATRFFGADKKAADGYAKQLREARVSLSGEFLRLTSLEQGAVIQYLRELGVDGLREAVANHRKRVEASGVLLTALRDKCIDSKLKANRRQNYINTLTCTLNSFCAFFPGKIAREITTDNVETWMDGNGWQPKTRVNYLGDVDTMFKFGARYGLANPCEKVERPKVDRNPKPFFTPSQADKLLKTCAQHPFMLGSGQKTRHLAPDIELLGYIAPVLFNGLRPNEAARIKPENVRWNAGKAIIDLSGKQTKLRLRRLVNLNDTCLYWLTLPTPRRVWSDKHPHCHEEPDQTDAEADCSVRFGVGA